MRIVFSFILIIFGIIGIIFPFIHGLAFLLAGLILVSFDFPWVDEKLKKYVSKNKKVEKLYKDLHSYLKSKFT